MHRFLALAAILLAAGAFLAGWNARSHRAERDLARVHERHAAALNQALADVRAIEQRRISDLEQLHHDTEQKLAAVADAARRAADQRVRDLATEYAARQRASADDSAAAGQCEAAAAAADLLAKLLGQLDELAEIYAADADQRRIAGAACEAAYGHRRSDRRDTRVRTASAECRARRHQHLPAETDCARGTGNTPTPG